MEQKRVPLQIKTLSDREFEGYGSVFSKVDLGGDVIAPGAFKATLKRHKDEGSLPLMFWAHDSAQVPGKWLDMAEDDVGLRVKGVLADTPLGNEIRTLLGMKAVKGLSIGFSIPRGGAEWDDEQEVRVIKRVDLWETSIVSIPMNPHAQVVHAKARLSASGEYVPTQREMATIKRDLERWLRYKGFTRAAAVAYASSIFADDAATADDRVEDNLLEDGATPVIERRDAVMEDDDMKALAERLNGVADGLLATLITRRLPNL